MKALEYPLELALGNSNACVANLQLNGAVRRFQCNRDDTLERELERVGQ